MKEFVSAKDYEEEEGISRKELYVDLTNGVHEYFSQDKKYAYIYKLIFGEEWTGPI